MGSNAGHPTSPTAAALGGRLMQLVGDRDAARFSFEISRVCAEPHPDGERPKYGDVLAWVVDAIVGVVIARLGAAGPGERFILDLRFADGGYVDVDALPASARWVLRTVSAVLAEDHAEVERSLTAAERQFDLTMRAETLADALIWLDFVLGVDLPDPPDVTTA
ncbi:MULTISPECIES: hypothetical protein [Rhodococcus]|uniref:hypothetical protein n=1 Tax=Rhodococcus TaxID=1827 RepID=UPI00106261A9|nr:hypothetical protein [Rhodococcus opacus]NHU46799.1 hypothetical protein [Rhodococcus sp. A14]MBA8961286.1 hypothetical protein [Rhodococcus opacus]MBP2202850.1 hypothetical protein [Rhodococcus opacus]MDV6243034.1 hypothetical protein [Rhodococcus opacus]UZG55487.1 hypothetical protein ONE62_36690 [Rhodococcus opacus]